MLVGRRRFSSLRYNAGYWIVNRKRKWGRLPACPTLFSTGRLEVYPTWLQQILRIDIDDPLDFIGFGQGRERFLDHLAQRNEVARRDERMKAVLIAQLSQWTWIGIRWTADGGGG